MSRQANLQLPELPALKPTNQPRRASESAASENDCRCMCGSLLARVVDGGVELKCRRCKRTLLVPFDTSAETAASAARPIESIPVRRAG